MGNSNLVFNLYDVKNLSVPEIFISKAIRWSSRRRDRRRRIETNSYMKTKDYLNIGGLDMPFATNAHGYSTTDN
jgi:hypothetical protein